MNDQKKFTQDLKNTYEQLSQHILQSKGRRILAISAVSGAMLLGANHNKLQAQIHFEDPISYPDSLKLYSYEIFIRSEFHDVDNDGDRDLLATTYDTAFYFLEDILFYENIGTESDFEFAAPQYIDMQSPQLSTSIFTFGDLDNDGDIDALHNVAFYDSSATYSYDREFIYYENESQNGLSFKAPVLNPYGLDQYRSSGYVAFSNLLDVDGDADLDILQVDFEYDGQYLTPLLRYMENTGTVSNPQFASPIEIPNAFKGINSPVLPTYGDLDKDGDIDILGVKYNYSTYTSQYIYSENIGENGGLDFDSVIYSPFNLDSIIPFGDFGEDPHLVDYDSDGDLDIFATAYYEPKVKLYLNTQTTFTKQLKLSDLGIKVFPNPVHEKVNLKIPQTLKGKVKVLTNTGKLLIERDIQHPQTEIIVSHLPSGVYFLQIQTKELEGSTTIVIEQ